MHGSESVWDPSDRILRTRLTGTVTVYEVELWRRELSRAVAEIPAHSDFKLLFDLHGYEPADLAAHKAMRGVIPELLASHGLRPAVLDLFDDQPEVSVTTADGVRCIAFANVHHDPAKMADYERRIAKPNQRFFTERDAAEAWLAGLSA